MVFNRENDPVHSCRVYKEIGCAHVDGMMCDLATCDIRKSYMEKPFFDVIGELDEDLSKANSHDNASSR